MKALCPIGGNETRIGVEWLARPPSETIGRRTHSPHPWNVMSNIGDVGSAMMTDMQIL